MSELASTTRRDVLKGIGLAATATAAGPVRANWLGDTKDVAALVAGGFQKKYSACFMCGAGCGLMALEKSGPDGKEVFLAPNADHPQRGYCGRGASALWIWNHPLRLKKPMKRVGERGEGRFAEISWDEALNEIAAKLKAAVAAKGERSVVFTSHDLTAPMQMVGWALGTPNIVNHAATCNTPGVVARRWTYAAPYDHQRRVDPDYENCRFLLLIGRTMQASMGAAHRVAQARAAGAKIAFVDPRRPDSAFADSQWLPILPGTDTALVLGMIREIVESRLADEKFLAAHTNAPLLIRDDGTPLTAADVTGDKAAIGYAVWDGKAGAVAFQGVKRNERGVAVEYVATPSVEPALDHEGEVALANGERVKVRTAWRLVRARVAPYSIDQTAQLTGLPAAQIRTLARDFATQGGVADDGWYWTRNGNDTDAARAVLLLNTVVGNADRKGGLAFSRGAGINLVSLNSAAKRVTMPLGQFELAETRRIDNHVYSEANGTFQVVVDAVLTGKPYPVSSLFVGGTTLIQREANVPRLIEALKKLDLVVVQDLLPQDVCDYADYVLPSNFFLEREEIADVKWTLAAALQRSDAVLPMPKGVDGRDDLWILLEVLRRSFPERAQKLGYGEAQASAAGFAAYKAQLDTKMLDNCLKGWSPREPEVASRVQRELGDKGYCVLGAKRYDELPYTKPFDTPSGKIEVYALRAVLNAALRQAKADPLPEYRPITAYKLPSAPDEFYVLSGKSMSNGSGTAAFSATGLGVGDRRIWMHPNDGARLGLKDGDAIVVEGLDTGVSGRAAVRLTRMVRPGVLFTYAFSGGYTSSALTKDARFAFMREGINPNVLAPGKAEAITGSLANNFSARVRKA